MTLMWHSLPVLFPREFHSSCWSSWCRSSSVLFPVASALIDCIFVPCVSASRVVLPRPLRPLGVLGHLGSLYLKNVNKVLFSGRIYMLHNHRVLRDDMDSILKCRVRMPNHCFLATVVVSPSCGPTL